MYIPTYFMFFLILDISTISMKFYLFCHINSYKIKDSRTYAQWPKIHGLTPEKASHADQIGSELTKTS